MGLSEDMEKIATQERELRLVVQPGSKVERTLRLLQLQSRFAIDHAGDGRAPRGAEEWAAAA